MPTLRPPGSELHKEIACERCRHIADVRQRPTGELDYYASILSQQGERLIGTFPDLDLVGAETFKHEGEPLAMAANVFERLAMAERSADPVLWERAKVDGRTTKDVMDRLWDTVSELRLRKRR